MKKILLIQIILAFVSLTVNSQDLSAKEKAEDLAKNEFSKHKYKKKEKYGVVVEKNKVVESTPVIKNNLSFYEGNYVNNDLQYTVEIRTDKQKRPVATLKIGDEPGIRLKNVSVTDAYFQAVKQNTDGTEEVWEGVFINRNANGIVEFGLGIKFPNALPFTEGLSITRIFLKKVSP